MFGHRKFVQKSALWVFALLFSACASAPKSFQVNEDKKLFVPTGVRVPAQILNWNETPDSIKENLSPEILASVAYQYKNEKSDLSPQSVVYFLKSKSTANLKLIENRGVGLLKDVKFGKTDFLKLKNKKKIIYSSYSHQLPISSTSGNGTQTISNLPRETLYATSESESQLVVAVSYRAEAYEERQIALDFIEKILFSNSDNAQKQGKAKK